MFWCTISSHIFNYAIIVLDSPWIVTWGWRWSVFFNQTPVVIAHLTWYFASYDDFCCVLQVCWGEQRHTEDSVHGGTNLMRDCSEKFTFGPICIFSMNLQHLQALIIVLHLVHLPPSCQHYIVHQKHYQEKQEPPWYSWPTPTRLLLQIPANQNRNHV